jgi:magnesium chelatase family protein
MNPCPYGYYGDAVKACTPFGPRARLGEMAWALSTLTKYQKWIAGLLLERININVEIQRMDYQLLSGDRLESSECIRTCGEAARQRQCERLSNMKSNNDI